jgi:hypothetical protein
MLGTTVNIYIGSCTLQGVYDDIYCDSGANITVQNCKFYGDYIGIFVKANVGNQNLTVEGCYFTNENQGVFLDGSPSNYISTFAIFNSTFVQCNEAIEALYTNWTNIYGNLIAQCQADAMNFIGCNHFNIINNFVTSTIGTVNYLINWYGNDSLNVFGNSFYGTSGSLFFYNSTSGTGNTKFDDGISMGNYWSDYGIQNPAAINNNGIWSIPYVVNNSIVDNYPLAHDPNYLIPIIVGTPIISTDMNTNLTLAWNVYGLRSIINSYIIYKNGTSVQSGQWNDNAAIQIVLSNVAFGNFNYTLWLSDGISIQQSSTILHVLDYAPMLSQVTNQAWMMGSGVHTLEWAVNDSAVRSSTYDIRLNGTVVMTGVWNAPSDQIALDLNASLSSWYNTIHFNSSTPMNYTVILTLDVSDGVLNSTQVVVIHINTLPANVTVVNNSAMNITVVIISVVGIFGIVAILGIPLVRVYIKIKKAGSK